MQNSLPLKEDESRYTEQWPVDCFGKSLARPHRVSLHYHRTLEINVFQNCRGTVRVGAREVDLAGLRVLVIPPLLPHSYDIPGMAQTMPREVLVLHLSLENLDRMVQLEKVLGWKPSILTLPVVHPAYDRLAEVVPGFLSLKKSDRLSLLGQVLAVFQVLDGARGTPSAATQPPRRDSARRNSSLLEIIAFSEKFYAKDLDLAAVADHLGWSRSYFCRFFKRCTGENYRNYLQRLRIDRAKIELAKGSSVTETCFRCGFSNLSHFIQVFRAYEGMTPGQFLSPSCLSNC